MKLNIQISCYGTQTEPLPENGAPPSPRSRVSLHKYRNRNRKGRALSSLSTFGPGSPHYGLQHRKLSQTSLTPTSIPSFFNFLGRTGFFIFIKKITNIILLLHISITLMERLISHQNCLLSCSKLD